MEQNLRRDLRLLQAWVVIATAGLLVLGLSWLGEAQGTRTRFEELDVERINIVESDGRVRLVIANGERQADATIGGRVIVPGRGRAAGMIFFKPTRRRGRRLDLQRARGRTDRSLRAA